MSGHPLDPTPEVGKKLKRAAEKLRNRPLTHEERRRLIETPLTFRVIPRKSWGGTLIRSELPTEGQRFWVNDPEDEEYGSIGTTRRLNEDLG
jgi:hypothetical protein